MYIAPNTVIKIIKNCPLDNTYTHTIYFNDVASQITYFSGLAKYTLTQQTYQRVNKGVMRVQYKAEDLYDCNYLMFQNSAFGSKWFYAFIKSVEYINNVTSEITFEIDVMQTWFFDYEIQPCFVERNHVLDDTPFTWFAPEPFAPAEYIVDAEEIWLGYTQTLGLSPYITLVASKVYDNDGNKLVEDIGDGKVYSGIYSGLWYYSVPVENYSDINSLIDALDQIGSGDAIVGIYMSPYPVTEQSFSHDVITPIDTTKTNFTGYNVHNNKLLQYPFVRIKIKSTDGNEMELKPELVNGDTLSGKFWFSTSLPPTITFTPAYGNVVANWDYAIQYAENPQCAWSSNLYANWQAQNVVANAMNKISSLSTLASAGAGLATAPATALLTDTAGQAIRTGANATSPWATEYRMSVLPGKSGGVPNSGSVNYAFNRIGFEGWCYRAHPYEARMFDEYFDRFGYAINEIRTPNRSGRPHWCYLKTREVSLVGSLPTDDIGLIKNIYNNGITFWNNGNDVGDYSLNNTLST